jgi:hypothetical protein
MALENLRSAENQNDGLFVDILADDGNIRIREKEFVTKIY